MKACNFPGAEPVGKPKDWIPELDGECGTIYVVRHFDELLGYNIQYSVYMPTEADIEALKNGGGIRLGIHGDGHPVFQLCAIKPETMQIIEPVPMWDLGDPI